MSITICDTHLARTVRYLSLTFEPVYTKYDTKFNGCEKMSSWDKLLKRFLELDHDIRFEEIVKVMKEYGYEIKQSVIHL